MARELLKRVSVFLICILISFSSFAQDQEQAKASGPRKQMAMIIFSGLGGAVLGLSTLSFYGRPQDKLSNIAIGFALGVIGGTIYVTYNAASVPKDYYQQGVELQLQRDQRGYLLAQKTPQIFNYSWNF